MELSGLIRNKQNEEKMEKLAQYLTVKDVADTLDISEESVRDFIKAKELKAVKVGKWRIHPDDLKNFVDGRSNL